MSVRVFRGLAIACALAAASAAPSAQAQVASAGAAAPDARPQVRAAVVEQPRPFGYVIGDLLTQRVLLEGGGRTVEVAPLPSPARVGIWFERRSVRVQRETDGRRWLLVEYQVINAPPALRTIRLPAWDLKTTSPASALRVAEWPISVGPLLRPPADNAPADSPPAELYASGIGERAAPADVRLRPDRAAPTVPTASIRESLTLWSAALAITLIAWVAWLLWRNYTDAASLPFARALRDMRHTDDGAPEAWQTLHHAFDQTAGRVVQMQSLPTLFARAPHLNPLRAPIETFFAQSSERFFGAGPPAQPVSTHTLCRDLRRLEKRAAR